MDGRDTRNQSERKQARPWQRLAFHRCRRNLALLRI